MSKLFSTTAVVAACLFAGAAQAGTVLLDYEGQHEKVRNSDEGLDFFNLNDFGPRVELAKVICIECQEQEIPVRMGPFSEDGRDDITVEVRRAVREGDEVIKKGFGRLVLEENVLSPFINTVSAFSQEDMYSNFYPVREFGEITQRGSFAYVDGDLATFGAGGNDGFVVDGSFDYTSNVAELYGPAARPNLLTSDNDTAVLGFRIDVVMEPFLQVMNFDGPHGECEIFFDDSPNGDGWVDDCEPTEEVLASYFGFIEVTRGSLTPGFLGVNNVAGAAAVVPSVPLPAPALMLGAGLAGLAGLRRRRKS